MKNELVVIWTSADREVALKMVFMYSTNSMLKGWWDKVHLLVWGPSSKLLSEDKELQDQISQMLKAGVKVMACKACADSYGVSEVLETLGVEVKYTGQTLTDFLQSGYKVITF